MGDGEVHEPVVVEIAEGDACRFHGGPEIQDDRAQESPGAVAREDPDLVIRGVPIQDHREVEVAVVVEVGDLDPDGGSRGVVAVDDGEGWPAQAFEDEELPGLDHRHVHEPVVVEVGGYEVQGRAEPAPEVGDGGTEAARPVPQVDGEGVLVRMGNHHVQDAVPVEVGGHDVAREA